MPPLCNGTTVVPPVERMYTYKEVAGMLGLAAQTLRRYVVLYNIPRWRRRGHNRRYIPESGVQVLMSRRYVPVSMRHVDATTTGE